jgi:hypothetical protein
MPQLLYLQRNRSWYPLNRRLSMDIFGGKKNLFHLPGI